LTEPVITVIIITQFNKQGEIKMKKLFKVLTLGAAMGAGVAGFMHAQDPGFYPGGIGRGYVSDISVPHTSNIYIEEQRRREREAGQGNWIQFIETKDGKVYVMQLDGQIYVVVPRTDGNVEIVSRETNRARIDELNRLFEQMMR
jgi:hypothetical protein